VPPSPASTPESAPVADPAPSFEALQFEKSPTAAAAITPTTTRLRAMRLLRSRMVDEGRTALFMESLMMQTIGGETAS
jgi:hypothetical protein